MLDHHGHFPIPNLGYPRPQIGGWRSNQLSAEASLNLKVLCASKSSYGGFLKLNRGTPKSSILMGCSIINHLFRVPPFLETPIWVNLSNILNSCDERPSCTWLCRISRHLLLSSLNTYKPCNSTKSNLWRNGRKIPIFKCKNYSNFCLTRWAQTTGKLQQLHDTMFIALETWK